MEKEIKRHQEVQELQWKIQEIFINAYDKKYDVQKTIDIIKLLFETREDDVLDKKFWERYGTIQANEEQTLFIW